MPTKVYQKTTVRRLKQEKDEEEKPGLVEYSSDEEEWNDRTKRIASMMESADEEEE